jgi:hypothetical protein
MGRSAIKNGGHCGSLQSLKMGAQRSPAVGEMRSGLGRSASRFRATERVYTSVRAPATQRCVWRSTTTFLDDAVRSRGGPASRGNTASRSQLRPFHGWISRSLKCLAERVRPRDSLASLRSASLRASCTDLPVERKRSHSPSALDGGFWRGLLRSPPILAARCAPGCRFEREGEPLERRECQIVARDDQARPDRPTPVAPHPHASRLADIAIGPAAGLRGFVAATP